MKSVPVPWWWEGWLPKGKLVLLEGDPGLGKSTLSMWMAARISTGEPFVEGGESRDPARVLLLNYEDSAGDTIKPRFIAAGGDETFAQLIDGCNGDGGSELFLLPNHFEELAKSLRQCPAGLVIIDPLVAALSPRVDSHNDQDVRGVLAPLAALAEETGTTILGNRHLVKSGVRNPITAGGGSIGFAAAVRTVLGLFQDPADPDRRVLAMVKSNLSRMRSSLSLSLHDAGGGVATVRLHGESDLTARALLIARSGPPDEEDSPDADRWLKNMLAASPARRDDVFRAGHLEGYPERTLDRARVRIGGISKQSGFGRERHAVWSLGQPVPANAATTLRQVESGGIGGNDGCGTDHGPTAPGGSDRGDVEVPVWGASAATPGELE